jgi:uncharacterized protein YbbC (DUF1343 family)
MKIVLILLCSILFNCRQESTLQPGGVRTGAEQTEKYLPHIIDKSVALVANHTTLIGNTHSADTLLSLGVKITRIFAPEHGFRGEAGAGDLIDNTIDRKTGIPVISLYGSEKKPLPAYLDDIDIMIYDIQDVGVRFYTYISTMHYVMEACAEKGIPLIIFDRPNPLGYYVDGPVLDTSYRSFVGMHPVPVVYGMTAGELARMINGEGWLKGGVRCYLTVIPCSGYSHNTYYTLPVSPSPNLNSMEAVYLYPSLCFFEGTQMSLGRGTDFPFRVIGHPEYPDKSFSFIPQMNMGNKNPVFLDTRCYGLDLRSMGLDTLRQMRQINLEWLIKVYSSMKMGGKFFTEYLDRLAGSAELRKQITAGKTAEEIRESWQPALMKFRSTRKKYLLYNDFQ